MTKKKVGSQFRQKASSFESAFRGEVMVEDDLGQIMYTVRVRSLPTKIGNELV